ncbi:MAG: hypothetical protein ACRCYS_16735, partial [Beijerinckiaceae bacterium]
MTGGLSAADWLRHARQRQRRSVVETQPRLSAVIQRPVSRHWRALPSHSRTTQALASLSLSQRRWQCSNSVVHERLVGAQICAAAGARPAKNSMLTMSVMHERGRVAVFIANSDAR